MSNILNQHRTQQSPSSKNPINPDRVTNPIEKIETPKPRRTNINHQWHIRPEVEQTALNNVTYVTSKMSIILDQYMTQHGHHQTNHPGGFKKFSKKEKEKKKEANTQKNTFTSTFHTFSHSHVCAHFHSYTQSLLNLITLQNTNISLTKQQKKYKEKIKLPNQLQGPWKYTLTNHSSKSNIHSTSSGSQWSTDAISTNNRFYIVQNSKKGGGG